MNMTAIATYNDINLEMQYALAADIENLQKKGESLIKVEGGIFLGEKGNLFLYEFTGSNTQLLEEDADIEVRVGSTNTYGSVSSIQEDGVIQVALEDFIGPKIPEATLVSSTFQLLKKLKEHLELLRNNSSNRSKLPEKLFGLDQYSYSENTDFEIAVGKERLNSDQESALRLALGSEVSFIWGPPGTGKTFTIARIVEALLSKGNSVLLISHTNTATDGALK